jgi:hypothetical protein
LSGGGAQKGINRDGAMASQIGFATVRVLSADTKYYLPTPGGAVIGGGAGGPTTLAHVTRACAYYQMPIFRDEFSVDVRVDGDGYAGMNHAIGQGNTYSLSWELVSGVLNYSGNGALMWHSGPADSVHAGENTSLADFHWAHSEANHGTAGAGGFFRVRNELVNTLTVTNRSNQKHGWWSNEGTVNSWYNASLATTTITDGNTFIDDIESSKSGGGVIVHTGVGISVSADGYGGSGFFRF